MKQARKITTVESGALKTAPQTFAVGGRLNRASQPVVIALGIAAVCGTFGALLAFFLLA